MFCLPWMYSGQKFINEDTVPLWLHSLEKTVVVGFITCLGRDEIACYTCIM